jgi:hypothetical protein
MISNFKRLILTFLYFSYSLMGLSGCETAISKKDSSENTLLRSIMVSKGDLLYASNLVIPVQNLKLTEIDRRIHSENIQTINRLLQGSPKLVFKFSELNCGNCVSEQIRLINKYTKLIGRKNILFLGAYVQSKNFNLFLHLNNISSPAYILSENINDNSKIEQANLPYYFITDAHLRVSNVFVPVEEEPELTEVYLKDVAKRFTTD